MSNAPWSSEPPVSAIDPEWPGSTGCRSASFLQVRGRHGTRDPARELVRLLRARSVPALPDPEEQQHPLDVRGRQQQPHPVERVREGVCEPTAAEERDELVHRTSVGLQVAMIVLAQVPDEDMERDVVLGEPGGHLDGEERAGELRDSQRSLERVVVRDRDERHPALPADPVDALRLSERLPEPGTAERVVAAVGRVEGVDVEVAARRRLVRTLTSYRAPRTIPVPLRPPSPPRCRGFSNRSPDAAFQGKQAAVRRYSSAISGLERMKSAVARLHAIGTS